MCVSYFSLCSTTYLNTLLQRGRECGRRPVCVCVWEDFDLIRLNVIQYHLSDSTNRLVVVSSRRCGVTVSVSTKRVGLQPHRVDRALKMLSFKTAFVCGAICPHSPNSAVSIRSASWVCVYLLEKSQWCIEYRTPKLCFTVGVCSGASWHFLRQTSSFLTPRRRRRTTPSQLV